MSRVRLDINGVQSYLGDDVTTEMTVMGELEQIDGRYILKYPDGTDAETMISVTPYGAVEVLKDSSEDMESYQMIFEKDKAFSSMYQTPMGLMDTLIIPTLVETDMKESSGRIELEYVLGFLGHQVINQRSLTYTVEQRKGEALEQEDDL